MQCYKPLSAFQHLQDGGKIIFNPNPREGNYHDFRPLNLPCGQCTGCRLEQSRQWAVRIMHESHMHTASCFVTLTYSTTPEFDSLNRADLTNFFKRLRYYLNQPIRYFAVGEYGEKTQRPHYHAIIFGTDFANDRKLYKGGKHPLYNSPTLSKAWPDGHAVFGEATFESAAYCARYCLKKVNRKDEDYEVYCDIETGEIISRVPEYAVMSRRPGIGQAYYDKYGKDILRTDKVIMRGRAMRPPRYYDKISEVANYPLYEAIKAKRIAGQDQQEHLTYEQFLRSQQAEQAKQLFQAALIKRK